MCVIVCERGRGVLGREEEEETPRQNGGHQSVRVVLGRSCTEKGSEMYVPRCLKRHSYVAVETGHLRTPWFREG